MKNDLRARRGFLSLLFVCILISSFVMFSCSDDKPEDEGPIEKVFIGDSIIELWNLKEYFPKRRFINIGLAGSHIDYLEQWAGKLTDETVLVLSGTSDLKNIALGGMSAAGFADRLWNAVEGLGAARVYVMCILPRGDKEALLYDYDTLIPEVNREIISRLPDHPSATVIDAYGYFLTDGKAALSLFIPEIDDYLHPGPKGYSILAHILKRTFETGMPGEVVR